MKKVYWYIAGITLLITGGIMTIKKLTIKNIIGLLPKHPTKTYGKRELFKITGIAVHHSAGDGFDSYAYARMHIQKGWPGIGYHFVIDPDGTINQTNSVDTISYHVASHNTELIGVMLIGNLSKHPPTPEQWSSAVKLVKHLRNTFPQVKFVKGHKEFKATECPGKYMNMDKFRREVNI